ncbi:hypothetical protein GCM10022277_08530 [Litoribacillus peritrichatus]|uniref:Uncharacterized protein n=1 Tax=Litoribacillus peritrichatus TaxID=718191 RepID=A0ABP7M7J8_9GAMM
MAEQPTTAGTFIIDKAHAYRTPTWAWSAIKWGTLLMDKPAKPPATPDFGIS